MYLLIDVGNTGLKFGLMQDGKILHYFRVSTQPIRTPDEYRILINALIAEDGFSLKVIKRIVLSSVVPFVTTALEVLADDLEIPILTVGAGVKTGLKIRTDAPSNIGADLVANAVAAYDRFASDCLAVAFGTALTFTVVNNSGELIGVTIAPGLGTALRGLVKDTAQLKMIPFSLPQSVIGRNTTHSLQAGYMYGFAGMAEAIVARIKDEMGKEVKVVTTGYEGSFFQMPSLGEFDPLLTLKGLGIIAEKNA